MSSYGRNQHNIVNIKNQPTNQQKPLNLTIPQTKYILIFAELLKTPQCSYSWLVGIRRNLRHYHQIFFIINYIVRKFSRKMRQCLYFVLEVYLGQEKEIVNNVTI